MGAVHDTIERGDVVSISARRVGEHTRLGEIVEVIGDPGHPHYRVRWEDGRESVLYPGESTSISRLGPRTAPAVAGPTEVLLGELTSAGVEFELMQHRRTMTAASEARSLGLPLEVVAKTVIVRCVDGRHIRAVVPASSTLSLSKLAGALNVTTVTLLNETDLLAAYPQFELGAVPPLGGPGGDTVVVDRSLLTAEHVVFEAGVHDASVRIRSDELVRIASAAVAEISA
jgi:Ala-tRNA(Pro) deacylase